MANKKIGDGVRRTGHLLDEQGEELKGAVQVDFDSRGAEIAWSRLLGDDHSFIDAFHGMEDTEVPRVLQFVDHQGFLTLAECREVGRSLSFNGIRAQKIRSSRVIHSGGPALTYDEINTMQSEIDGLAAWSGLSTVSTTLEFDDDRGRIQAAVLRAESPPEVRLGGDLDLTLTTGFSLNPRPKGSVHALTDILELRTASEVPTAWTKHQVRHRMIQDLMCLAYGRACQMTIQWVSHADDRIGPGEGAPIQRDVYAPAFGRRSAETEPLDRARDRPLFRHADVDAALLEQWIDDYEHWSRPTWIAVGTLFQRGMTIEVLLLQIGVAIEALGYALWDKANRSATNGRRTPNYLDHVERIVAAVGVDHVNLYGSDGAAGWPTAFNALFKGAKHADHPLPDPLEAKQRFDQGMLLTRCWLAVQLGVDRGELLKRLGDL